MKELLMRRTAAVLPAALVIASATAYGQTWQISSSALGTSCEINNVGQIACIVGTDATVTSGGTTRIAGANYSSLAFNDGGHLVGNNSVAAALTSGIQIPPGVTRVNALLNDGRMVGAARDANGNEIAALIQNNSVTLLGTLPGHTTSVANSINVNGVIVGSSGTGSQRRPFVYTNGRIGQLPTLAAYPAGEAVAINEVNQIAGNALSADGNASRAYLYSQGTGSVFDIPVQQANSVATGMNSFGHVVGYSYNSSPASSTAFLYANGNLQLLNNLVSAAGWTLERALGLNEAGQIVGTGKQNGVGRTFILTPPVTRLPRSRYALAPGEVTADLIIPSFNPTMLPFSASTTAPWIQVQSTFDGIIRLRTLPNTGVTARSATIFTLPNNGTYNLTQGTNFPIFSDVTTPVSSTPTGEIALYAPAINLLSSLNITNGCAVNPLRYCPEDPLLRVQAAVFIVRALLGDNFAYPEAPYFGDVPASNPAFKYVQKFRELGYTSGCGGGNFCPNFPISRSDFAIFLVRGLANGDSFTSNLIQYFHDVPPAHPAFRYVQKLRELRITSGCNALTPKYCADQATSRAHAAVLLIRALFGGFGI